VRASVSGSFLVAIAALLHVVACNALLGNRLDSTDDSTSTPEASIDAPPASDGPRDGDSVRDGDGGVDAPPLSFHCPPPANSCRFTAEACCYTHQLELDGGGSDIGQCIAKDDVGGCSLQNHEITSCDGPEGCRKYFDAASAFCCYQYGRSDCSLAACSGGMEEICPRDQPSSAGCSSGKVCSPWAGNLGVCQ
jgi:hypothetical protein